MQKRTRSILEELDAIYEQRHPDQDQRHVIEGRAGHVIASAIRLMDQIDAGFSAQAADNLKRKLLNSIRDRDPGKFVRTVRRIDDH